MSLLEKVLGHTDDHAEEVKAKAKVCAGVCVCLYMYEFL